MRIYLFAILLAITSHASLSAQEVDDTTEQRRNCERAVPILTTGVQSASSDDWSWALHEAHRCGATAGNAYAAAIRAGRFSVDTAALNTLTAPTRKFRDGQIFEAALAVAGDPSASTPARIFAFRTLMWTAWPMSPLEYDDLEQGRCTGVNGGLHVSLGWGAPVPPDYLARMRATSLAVFNDLSAPGQLKHAAACARNMRPWPGFD